MAKFLPKELVEEVWQPLVQHRDYAVLCGPEDSVYFRFGSGHGMHIGINASPSGHVVSSIDFETGEATLLGKLPADWKVVLGRTSDCGIKVMHAIVSRQHLELALTGNILVVRDVGSTNGTFLLKEIKYFDIAEYLDSHPLEKAQDSTLDWIHEVFGPTLDDFLKNYSQTKGQ